MARKTNNGYVERPAIDKMADANMAEKVRQIKAARPKEETLTDRVKQVLGK
jgi:hypothetical protein